MSLWVKVVYSKSLSQVLTSLLERNLISSWEDVYSAEKDLGLTHENYGDRYWLRLRSSMQGSKYLKSLFCSLHHHLSGYFWQSEDKQGNQYWQKKTWIKKACPGLSFLGGLDSSRITDRALCKDAWTNEPIPTWLSMYHIF